MLWLVMKGQSEQIVACNIHKVDTTGNGVEDTYQLWVERSNGKTRKIKESRKREEVAEVKDAIDFAIREGHKSLELN